MSTIPSKLLTPFRFGFRLLAPSSPKVVKIRRLLIFGILLVAISFIPFGLVLMVSSRFEVFVDPSLLRATLFLDGIALIVIVAALNRLPSIRGSLLVDTWSKSLGNSYRGIARLIAIGGFVLFVNLLLGAILLLGLLLSYVVYSLVFPLLGISGSSTTENESVTVMSQILLFPVYLFTLQSDLLQSMGWDKNAIYVLLTLSLIYVLLLILILGVNILLTPRYSAESVEQP